MQALLQGHGSGRKRLGVIFHTLGARDPAWPGAGLGASRCDDAIAPLVWGWLRSQGIRELPGNPLYGLFTRPLETVHGVSANHVHGFGRFNLQNLVSFAGTWRVECLDTSLDVGGSHDTLHRRVLRHPRANSPRGAARRRHAALGESAAHRSARHRVYALDA